MRRRRLTLHYSSDDDDEEEFNNGQHQHQQPNLSNSTIDTPSNPNPTHTTTRRNLSISDDDFVDVREHLSPPSPPIPDFSIYDLLQNRGLKLRREWFNSCIQSLNNSIPGFSNLDVAGKAELCFGQFLFSDMNVSGDGILPQNVHHMHLLDLPGPFVLQVDEIVNISAPLKDRYHNVGAGIKRCLKLSMTDGIQRVFGMEYRPIAALELLAPAGLKVCIHNVHVRRGILLLVPEVIDVLGGVFDDLDAARQRLVSEVNKPPRGKRTRTGSVPSLSSRATCAAWQTDGVNDHRHTANLTPRHRGPVGMSDQGADTRGSTREADNVRNSRSSAEHSRPSNSSVVLDDTNMNNARTPNHGSIRERGSQGFAVPSVSCSSELNPPRNTASAVRDTGGRGKLDSTSSNFSVNLRRSITEDLSISMSRSNAEANLLSSTMNLEEINMIGASRHNHGEERRTVADPNVRRNPEPNPFLDAALDDRDTDMGEGSDATIGAVGADIQARIAEPFCVPHGSSFTEPNPSSNAAANRDEIDMIDVSMPLHGIDPASDNRDTDMTDVVEHPLILAGDRESPFTYLASLFAKLSEKEEDAPVVQGRIKCFMTGVKEFLFKGRATFELHVYIDDGSLISEILIDHNVVEDAIGHSPHEVCAALSSPDKSISTRMRETMKRFQVYLVNFEGILVVEIRNRCGLPVAVEMRQGCSSSDARLLLRRVKEIFTSPQTPRRQPTQAVDPIDISP